MERPDSIRARVPGKLMLAGEYASLAGAPALVCAIDKYCECTARPAPAFALEGLGRRWDEGGSEVAGLSHARAALRASRDYLEGKRRALPPLAISIVDDLRAPDGQKLGLGGSAGACVGVVAACLASAGPGEVDGPLVFKLAAVAHASAQGVSGSALDVAAATFGGTLFTWRFDVDALCAAWKAGPEPFAAAVDRAEPPARERPGDPPGVLIAFSGESASTPELVAQVERFAGRAPRAFAEFVARTSAACDRLRRALEGRDEGATAEAMAAAGRQLEELGARSGAPIVTDAHRRIILAAQRHGLVAKVSGAGGGDSCVALGAPERLDALAAALGAEGVLAMRREIDPGGVRVD